MKKLLLIFSLLLMLPCFGAAQNDIVCPYKSLKMMDNESVLNRVTGLSFLSKKIVETAIRKEIYKETGFNIDASINLFSVKALKKGEFKELKLKGKNLHYESFSLAGFEAQTICPYNRVILKDKKIYYPQDLYMKFKGEINNQDVQNVINSEEFKTAISKVSLKVFGVKGASLLPPKIELKQGFVFFDVPIQTLFLKKPINVKLYSEIGVKNNKIELKNINVGDSSDSAFNDLIKPALNVINPFLYNVNSANGKYAKLFVTKAQISDNIINIEGIVTVKKNYGGASE